MFKKENSEYERRGGRDDKQVNTRKRIRPEDRRVGGARVSFCPIQIEHA
jgi:hypothetical protein